MLKQKGPGYTAQMKAKVNYPKLKSKEDKNVKKAEPVKIEVKEHCFCFLLVQFNSVLCCPICFLGIDY